MVKKYLSFKNHGLTLIEVIVSIALISIVALSIVGVFVSSSVIYRDIYSYNEMQQQSQSIMDFLSDTIIHSEKIDYMLDETNLSEIRFKDKSLSENERHIFSVQKDLKVEGNSLRYGRKSSAQIEVGNYIDKINVLTLPEETHYKDAKGIKITLTMKKRGKTVEIFKKIYFRN